MSQMDGREVLQCPSWLDFGWELIGLDYCIVAIVALFHLLVACTTDPPWRTPLLGQEKLQDEPFQMAVLLHHQYCSLEARNQNVNSDE